VALRPHLTMGLPLSGRGLTNNNRGISERVWRGRPTPAHGRLPDVIDAHVHLLPDRLGAKVRAFFERGGIDGLAYPIDHDIIATRLTADGITAVWNLPYVHKPGMAVDLNAASAAIAASGLTINVVAGASVHPADDDPATIVRRAVEDLGCGVLKLHCSVGDHEPTDPRLEPVWEYVESIRLPVVIHAGHGVDGRTQADELGPVGEVARRHPEARLVLAHCGHHAVDEAIALLEHHPHLHADLTPVLDELATISAAQATAVASKLLLGTDAPNTCFRVPAVIDQVRAWALPAADEELVLGGTAARLQAEIHR